MAVVAVVSLGLGVAGGVVLAGGDDKPTDVRSTSATTRGASSPATTGSEATTTTTGGEVTPTTTTATTTTSTGPPAPGGPGSRENPIPFGQPADLGGGWSVKVTAAMADGYPAIKAENDFNDPPPAGKQYFLVTVEMSYSGTEESNAYDINFELLGDRNVAYSFGDICPVLLPTPLDSSAAVFQGGTVAGNLCFVVDTAEAPSIELSAERFFEFDAERTFFALA